MEPLLLRLFSLRDPDLVLQIKYTDLVNPSIPSASGSPRNSRIVGVLTARHHELPPRHCADMSVSCGRHQGRVLLDGMCQSSRVDGQVKEEEATGERDSRRTKCRYAPTLDPSRTSPQSIRACPPLHFISSSLPISSDAQISMEWKYLGLGPSPASM